MNTLEITVANDLLKQDQFQPRMYGYRWIQVLVLLLRTCLLVLFSLRSPKLDLDAPERWSRWCVSTCFEELRMGFCFFSLYDF
jgi:hypothetical protein